MEKELIVDNQTISLKFNDGANCWQTKTIIDDLEIEIEIDFEYHTSKEVDWENFKEFIKLVNKVGFLKKLINDAEPLAFNLAKAFYRECYENVSDHRAFFRNSIFYKGKTSNNLGCCYSLIFDFMVKRDNQIFGDAYGMYLVDIENIIITGSKRIQL